MKAGDDGSDILSTMSKLLPVYAIYFFVSGWAFWDYYFRYFGIDPRSLDIGFYDTLMKGFTVLFSGQKLTLLSFMEGAGLLWLIYVVLIVLTVLVLEKVEHRLWSSIFIVSLLLSILLAVYFISRGAGLERAQLDSGDMTRLPAIVFTDRTCTYHGKLLLLKGETYFIHGVAPIDSGPQCSVSGTLQLSIYRAEELSEVKITENRNEHK